MRLLIIPAFTLTLSVVLFLTVMQTTGIPTSFDEAVVWMRSFGDWLWIAASGVILADSFLIMPSDAAMMALGLVYGMAVGGVLSGLASVAGGLLAFGVVRALGEGFALWVVGERDLRLARGFYERWGAYAVATARAVGGPAENVILLAGLSRMRWRSVLAALCAGGIPAGVLKAGLGAFAEQHPITAILAAVLLAILATWVAQRLTRRFADPTERDEAEDHPNG
jgi:uncharacterized membrane protein YdjX (TVP38/TMEM64 family)